MTPSLQNDDFDLDDCVCVCVCTCLVPQGGEGHPGSAEEAGYRGQPEVQPRVQRHVPDGGTDQRTGRK